MLCIIPPPYESPALKEAAEKVHLERNVYSRWTFIFISIFITLAYIGNIAIE